MREEAKLNFFQGCFCPGWGPGRGAGLKGGKGMNSDVFGGMVEVCGVCRGVRWGEGVGVEVGRAK